MPDLAQLEAEVQALQEQLAQLEQEHADLRVELAQFELQYNARVGPIEAQLAATRLHIKEYELRIELLQWRGKSLGPSQLEAEVEYRLREQRQRAEAIHANAEYARSAVSRSSDAARAVPLDLKQIYRELAKRTHPDLASDEEDRALRSRSMAAVNEAYEKRDLATLRRLLRQTEAGQRPQLEDEAQHAARLRNEYAALRNAVLRVKTEIAEMNQGSLMQLKIEYAMGRPRGRDVLKETARQMQAQLDEAESELSGLMAKFQALIKTLGWAEE